MGCIATLESVIRSVKPSEIVVVERPITLDEKILVPKLGEDYQRLWTYACNLARAAEEKNIEANRLYDLHHDPSVYAKHDSEMCRAASELHAQYHELDEEAASWFYTFWTLVRREHGLSGDDIELRSGYVVVRVASQPVHLYAVEPQVPSSIQEVLQEHQVMSDARRQYRSN